MQYSNFFVILTLYFVYCRCEEKLEEVKEKEGQREGKQLIDKVEHGGWRTMNPQEWQKSDEWIPKNDKPAIINEYSETLPRRRRLRKRKRRPGLVEESSEFPQLKEHSHTLEDADESWMEMDEEAIRAPHNRRRTVPAYFSDSAEHEEKSPLYEKVRDPFTALEEAEAKSRLKKKSDLPETTTMSNLKAILKQTGGSLNLSELLQRKNLSLSDLLKGKQHAISALTEKIETSTDPVITVSYKTTIPPNLVTQSTKRHFEVSTDSVNDVNYKDLSTINNNEVITEQPTEKRIFVPSYSKTIPFHYKHSTVKFSSTSEPVTVTSAIKNSTRSKYNDYRAKHVSLKPKLQNSLPLTSAKLHKPSGKIAQVTTTPTLLKAFTIDLHELFGFTESTTHNNDKSEDDAPLRMAINVDSMVKSTQAGVTTMKPEQSTQKKRVTEKLKPTNARDEILEVLKDLRSRQNLSRILEIRNMTIDELVAQRERGSSQIHLADIFHNQTREPEPPSEPYVGVITGHMGRKAKTLQHPVSITKNIERKITNSPFMDLNTLEYNVKNESIQKPTLTVTSFPTYKIAVDKILKQNQAPPFQLSVWKKLYPNLYSENQGKEFENKAALEDNQAKVDEILQSDVHRIEDVENTISETIDHKLNVEVNENNFEHNIFMRLPSGVKSAIIASGALVAVSLLVFLTILVICKWSSKKKTRVCYSDVYSGSRIKSPILETRPKRTIRTIMNETLGRKKTYSNAYPQNISDYFWENDKKPFQ